MFEDDVNILSTSPDWCTSFDGFDTISRNCASSIPESNDCVGALDQLMSICSLNVSAAYVSVAITATPPTGKNRGAPGVGAMVSIPIYLGSSLTQSRCAFYHSEDHVRQTHVCTVCTSTFGDRIRVDMNYARADEFEVFTLFQYHVLRRRKCRGDTG